MLREQFSRKRISAWSGTATPIISAALELAEIGPDDLVFDLGCGDGRVVVRAARMYGARAVGFEIDPKRLRQTRARIERRGVGDLVRVRRQDLLSIPDLQRATIVYLNLPQHAMNRIKPQIRRMCRPGTRILSVGAWFNGWKPVEELTLPRSSWTWYIGLWRV